MNKLILILAMAAVGCANTQILEQAKREAAYRKLLDENQNTTTPTAGPGPIEMPQEWIDQWKNSSIDFYQK